jgi:hypothetical protein
MGHFPLLEWEVQFLLDSPQVAFTLTSGGNVAGVSGADLDARREPKHLPLSCDPKNSALLLEA